MNANHATLSRAATGTRVPCEHRAQLYAVPLEGQVTNHITAMFFNGRHVVLHYWTYLRAYDPATGEQAW